MRASESASPAIALRPSASSSSRYASKPASEVTPTRWWPRSRWGARPLGSASFRRRRRRGCPSSPSTPTARHEPVPSMVGDDQVPEPAPLTSVPAVVATVTVGSAPVGRHHSAAAAAGGALPRLQRPLRATNRCIPWSATTRYPSQRPLRAFRSGKTTRQGFTALFPQLNWYTFTPPFGTFCLRR